LNAPPNLPVYTECIIKGVLWSFYTSVYFTWGLSDGDTCPIFSGPPSIDISWTFGTGLPFDEDREGLTWTSVDAAAQDLNRERRSRHPIRLRKSLAHKSVSVELVFQQHQGGLRLVTPWHLRSLMGMMTQRGPSTCRASDLHPQQCSWDTISLHCCGWRGQNLEESSILKPSNVSLLISL
jgi:hypothetical protein